MNRTLAIAIVFTARLAVAQTEPVQPTPPATPAPEASAQAQEDVGLLQQKLDGLVEQHVETKSTVDALKRLKLSGYVQGRYTYADVSKQGTDAKGAPLVRDGFSVRRGRLKAVYSLEWSELTLQIDATNTGVALRDAEAKLIEPWTGRRLELAVGQMKWPFGYEVVQSSVDREFPERSRVVRAFANGERDRGAKINAKVGMFRFSGGVFDGNGIANTLFPGVDNDKNKDGVARLGVDLKWIAGGVSGWYGKTYKPDTFDGAGAISAPGQTYDRNRIGADVQLYLDVLPLGGTAVKGEFIAGRTWQRSGVEQFGVPALGWYALVVQNVGDDTHVGVRYDYFDPLAGTPDGVSSSDPTAPNGNNGVGTLGVVVGHYWNESLKVSAAYELVTTGAPDASVDPKDNLFTVQLQAKF